MTLTDDQIAAIDEERARLRDALLRHGPDRPESAAQGVHHLALLCSDVERTIRFYQDVLEFPLTEIFENRDYRGSNHFFFDLGNGNALAFFDFPGLDLGPYQEVLGGFHHLAISVPTETYRRLKAKLADADIATHEVGGRSLYFQDPDGVRLELLCEDLGQMGGRPVL